MPSSVDFQVLVISGLLAAVIIGLDYHLDRVLVQHAFEKMTAKSRDAAGHYPTRATRPVTRPALNRANYPYYP